MVCAQVGEEIRMNIFFISFDKVVGWFYQHVELNLFDFSQQKGVVVRHCYGFFGTKNGGASA